MRRKAARNFAMARMALEEMRRGVDLPENVIVYDVRMGKIPNSYANKDTADYDIHVPLSQLTVIRIENDISFLCSLVKGDFIAILEKNDETGEYEDWKDIKDLDAEIEKIAEYFVATSEPMNDPRFKHLSDAPPEPEGE